jgi:hypothetical protein
LKLRRNTDHLDQLSAIFPQSVQEARDNALYKTAAAAFQIVSNPL